MARIMWEFTDFHRFPDVKLLLRGAGWKQYLGMGSLRMWSTQDEVILDKEGSSKSNMTDVLIRGKCGHRLTEGRQPHEDRGTGWSHLGTRQEHGQIAGAERDRGDPLPEPTEGVSPPGLREAVSLCCFKMQALKFKKILDIILFYLVTLHSL